MLLKPRFGSRMWSGIWPPSKPAIETPSRLFWPFWPRPAVLPLPEPMPRPTRILDLRAPALSRSSFSFIVCTRFRFCRADRNAPPEGGARELLADAHHVSDLADHAADIRRVLQLDGPVHLVEPQADQRRPLALFA